MNYQFSVMLSFSVAEISAGEEALVAPFLFRLSVHKNDRISDALPTDISATEKLSNTENW